MLRVKNTKRLNKTAIILPNDAYHFLFGKIGLSLWQVFWVFCPNQINIEFRGVKTGF